MTVTVDGEERERKRWWGWGSGEEGKLLSRDLSIESITAVLGTRVFPSTNSPFFIY